MKQGSLPGLGPDHEDTKQSIILVEPLLLTHFKDTSCELSQIALSSEDKEFTSESADQDSNILTHSSGVQFKVHGLEEIRSGNNKGKFRVTGEVKRTGSKFISPHKLFNINGTGKDGKCLRRAQSGSVYSLLSHWSLSNDVATIVLPTGTGKTETMLVATLADRAKRTLVIVPTVQLKDQISGKFSDWGILRELGVIPENSENPKVLVLRAILKDEKTLNLIEQADVVVTTPALLARAESRLLNKLKKMISHVFFDEAHHVKAKEWAFLKGKFSDSKIVQFTATPYRNDRKPIEGSVVYNYPLSQAVKDECFSKMSLVSVSERHPRKKDKAIADAAMERLKADREKGFVRHRIMVRAEDRVKAKGLFEQYQRWFPDERIVLIHSGIKDRKSKVQSVLAGGYDIVVCVDMLKEGFDYPDFKIAAVHGVHKSLAVLLQFIGRFARTQEGLGPASFVVNFAEEKMSVELEDLFQEGSGWEEVISEIADAKKSDAESLLAFLQGCKPYSGFDAPDVELNPKLVYPALSCVCLRANNVNWREFQNAFNLRKYALSQPYFNRDENVFYFTTQKREKVKWARTDIMRDQKWDLIAMHHDEDNKILYIGFSEKRLDLVRLVQKITGAEPDLISGDNVFRSFDNIKRLSIVHAGIFKPANHLHRYSRLSGADVTTELSRWKEGKRCQKSDFVGIGYRNGFPVGIGASVKGKVWSPARSGDLKEWKSWCLDIGRMLTDESIDSNSILENSAEKNQLSEYPDELRVLATDWSEQIYDRINKLTLERPGKQSYLLAECVIQFLSVSDKSAKFKLLAFNDEIPFSIELGGENGHRILGLDDTKVFVEGLKSHSIPLKQFFQEQPPTLFLLNGCTISGSIHTDYGEGFDAQIPSTQIQVLDWIDVDLTIESMYKSTTVRSNSIQEYMMKHLVERGAHVVFNDDNSGESADIVAIFYADEKIRFELVHCKYSKSSVGDRLSDLYEVCGQAIVSLRYKWKPEELLRHLLRRNGMGVLKSKRFYHGDEAKIAEISKALKYTNVEFEFAVAQPGVSAPTLTTDQKNFLGSIYSTVVEMTETKLVCYFNQK